MREHDQDAIHSGTRARPVAGAGAKNARRARAHAATGGELRVETRFETRAEAPVATAVAPAARVSVADAPTVRESVAEPAAPRVAPRLAPRLGPSESQRMAVSARPLRPVDTQMVEQATWMMGALDVLDDSPALPAWREPAQAPALVDEFDSGRSSVVIVEGNLTGSVPVIRIAPPRRAKRHWASGLVILALVAAVVAAGVATVSPVARGREQLAVNSHGPLGLSLALDTANHAPSGQWIAQVGVQPDAEIGGGAGPGVKAPGSAGLPVSSVTVIVNTAPAPSPDTGGSGVSPAPLSPWPPSWAYVAVPGYSSFGINGSGGFYSWAFGQCTWWAQYQRRDENLAGMGNAQYWASGARARGYTVGSMPRAGATVVFQPGVQGAGGAGHVAHVVKVYPGNWFLISEMNFYWNGGGWGRVDYRLAHAGSGVQFIY